MNKGPRSPRRGEDVDEITNTVNCERLVCKNVCIGTKEGDVRRWNKVGHLNALPGAGGV